MSNLAFARMCAAVALVAFGAGVAVARGRLRGAVSWYLDEGLLRSSRHAAFTMFPIALVFLIAAGVFFSAGDAGEISESDAIGNALVFALFPAIGWMAWRALVPPPRYLKPHWLRDAEDRQRGRKDTDRSSI